MPPFDTSFIFRDVVIDPAELDASGILIDLARTKAALLSAQLVIAGLKGTIGTLEAEVADLRAQATTDALTGLINLHGAVDAFKEIVSETRRANSGKPFKNKVTIAFLDLDNFGILNKAFGHHIGNIVLKDIASALKETCRPSDKLIRWGGEEMMAISDHRHSASAARFAARMLESIRSVSVPVSHEMLEAINLSALQRELTNKGFALNHHTLSLSAQDLLLKINVIRPDRDGLKLNLTASIGVIGVNPDKIGPLETVQDIQDQCRLAEADLAMRAAKGAGKNDVKCRFNTLGPAALEVSARFTYSAADMPALSSPSLSGAGESALYSPVLIYQSWPSKPKTALPLQHAITGGQELHA